MKLSLPLAIVLALLSNLVPVISRAAPNQQNAGNGQLPPPQK
jgi:hypothetical protein